MFDPTAFENMKVVIEGELYDRDLSGEIRIEDRNDIFNSAKLSRKYEITFTDQLEDITCTFIMEADLANLAAELLPTIHSNKLAGSHISIKFTFMQEESMAIFQKIERTLKEIWGAERMIKQLIIRDPLSNKSMITNETTIIFNRLVYEDQVDDIIAMVDYMNASLAKLRELKS